MAAPNVRVKLLIDTKVRKVLFAEGGKDFVDFLFYLLSLPVGTVVKLLRQNSMVGCLSNLYGSIENLSETYMQQNQIKNSVLNPKSQLHVTQIPLLLTDHEPNTRKFYTCPNIRNSTSHYYGDNNTTSHCYVADVPNSTCPSCNCNMTSGLSYVTPAGANTQAVAVDGGFVKPVVTYMIMDNLEVKPMSTISSITLLNKFNVKDVGALEEKVVNLSVNEGLKLLEASLECNTVLTSVFLGTNV